MPPASRVLEELKRFNPGGTKSAACLILARGPGTALHAAAWNFPVGAADDRHRVGYSAHRTGPAAGFRKVFMNACQKGRVAVPRSEVGSGEGPARSGRDVVRAGGNFRPRMAEKAVAGAWGGRGASFLVLIEPGTPPAVFGRDPCPPVQRSLGPALMCFAPLSAYAGLSHGGGQ